MLGALGGSLLVVNTRLSRPSAVRPQAESVAPPVAAELSQPRPAPAGGLAHGQPITPPAPGSHRLARFELPRTLANTSARPLVSLATRFVAKLANAAQSPSPDSASAKLERSACAPAVETLRRSVVPVSLSCTKMSPAALVSPATRFEAKLE